MTGRHLKGGFTLIELLIVIAIVAALSVVVISIIQPAEFLKKARDSRRLSEIASIERAVQFIGAQDQSISLGNTSTTYISISDPTATSSAGTDCSGITGLPSQPPGWRYHCAASSTYRNIDGTGWIPIGFSQLPGHSPLPTLPVDPVNTTANLLYYSYVTDGFSWTVTTRPEAISIIKSIAQNDKGTDDLRFERGTDISLWADAMGLQLYLPFEEGGGTTARDTAGNNYVANITGATWVVGKQKTGLHFTNPNQAVLSQWADIASFPSAPYNWSGGISVVAWHYDDLPYPDPFRTIISNVTGIPTQYQFSLSKFGVTPAFHIYDNAVPTTHSLAMLTGCCAQGSTWYQQVGTFDGNATGTLYMNGALVRTATTSASFTGVATVNPTLRIGGNVGSSPQAFNGTIDEIRIYNRVLSPVEVQLMYDAIN